MSGGRIISSAIFVACFGATAQRDVLAQTATWTTTDGSWSLNTNWLGDTLPVSSDTTAIVIPFNGQTGTITITQDLADPFILNSLTVTTTTRNVVLNGNALYFQGNLPSLMVDTTATVALTVAADVYFDGSLSISTTGHVNASMLVSGNISTSGSGPAVLTLGGSATSASKRIAGIISDGVNGGSVSVVKIDAGQWTLTNVNNSFTGGVTIDQGILRYTNQNALGDALGSITLGTASNLTASLSYTGAGVHTFDRTIGILGTAARTIASETNGALTFNGTINFLDSEAKSIILSAGSATAQNDFQSLIVDNGAETTRLTKTGLGLWIVSNAANFFTGGVQIESGILRVSDTAALNLANNNLTFAATPNTTTVGVLETNGTLTMALGTGAGQVNWANNLGGGFSAFGGDLHVTLNGDPDTAILWGGGNGATKLSSTNEVQLNSPTADAVTYVHNSFLLATSGALTQHRINVDNNTATLNDWAVITGTLTGSGGILKTGEGKLVLTGVNDFSGGVTLHSGTLEVANVETNLNLSNQPLRFSGPANGLSGLLQTAGTLNFAGLGTEAGQVSWIPISTTGGSGGFAALGGALNVTITTDTVTPLVWGSTTDFLRNNAELVLSSTSADDVVMWFNAIDFGGAARQIRVLENVSLTSDYAVIAGNLSNGGITKTGAGMLVLSGNNTFSGGITIGADIVRGLDPAANLNIMDQVNGNNIQFRGTGASRAILETSGSLTNAIGSGNGQFEWATIGTTGGTGGFSALGGALDILLNNDAVNPLVWHDTPGFLRNTAELQFNTVYSDNVVTFHNPINLGNVSRTIRVNDNTESTADLAVLAGVISSTDPNLAGLLIAGTGTLVLSAENTYTLTTTVTAGSTLQLGNAGTSGGVAGVINAAAGGRTVFRYSTVHDMSTNIIGAGDVVVNSLTTGGGVAFSTAKTFTGITSIQSGVLQYGIDNALPIAARVAIGPDGVLDLTGFNGGITTLSDGDGGGGVIRNSAVTGSVLTVTQGSFGGLIQDATLGLLKMGITNSATEFGILRLTSSNSFSGDSTLTQGTIIVGHDHALGDANWAITGTAGILESDGQLRTLANTINLLGNGSISGSSDITFDGTITTSAASRTLTINNTGVTRLNNLALSESATARTLSLWLADDANLVIGQMNTPANNGGLSLTGSPTGNPGATVLFADIAPNTRTVTIAGVGRSIRIADGIDFKTSGAGVFSFVNSDHTLTVGAGADIGPMSFRVASASTQIDVFGSMTGTVTITGAGSKVIYHAGSSSGNGAVILNNDTTYEVQAGATVGNGSITTLGSATIILDGTKGTGNVTLDTGAILIGSGSSSGTWTMAAGSNIYVGGAGTTGTLTLGGLVLNGGSIRFDLGTISDLLVSTARPLINQPATINVSDAGGFGIGDYTLISGYSGTIANIDRFNVIVPAGFKKTLVSNAGSLVLQISEAALKTWSGSESNVWDDNLTANFTGSSTYVNADHDAVAFLDGAANTSITIANGGLGVAPTSVLVNNSATTYTFDGEAITGDGVFVKQGDGLLVILNDNTSTGAVQIVGGTVQLGNGGTTGQFEQNNIITLNNNAVLAVDRSNTLTLTGNIAGTGSVIMNGTGTLQLAGFNTYFNGTTVNSGTFEIIDDGIINEFGGLTINGGTANVISSTNQTIDAITVNAGALNLLTGNVTATTVNIAGGTLNIDGPTLLTSAIGGLFNLESGTVNLVSSNLTLSVSQLGGGNGETALLNVGTGLTLSLWNTLTFTAAGDGTFDSNGAIIQGDGVISMSGTRTLVVNDSINAVNDLTISSTIAAGGFIKTGAGRLYLQGVNQSAANVGITGGGSVVIGNDLAFGGGVVTVTDGILLGDGVARTIANDFNVRILSITGTSALNFGTLNMIGSRTTVIDNTALTTIGNLVAAENNQARNQTIAGTGNVTFGLISAGPGTGNDSVIFDGQGVYTLLGANTYSGNTLIRNGTVVVSNADAFAISAAVRLGSTAGGATAALFLDGGLTLAKDLDVLDSLGSDLTIGVDSLLTTTFAGNLTLSQNVNLSAATGGTVVYTGALSSGGVTNGGFTKVGGGTLVVAGNNVYTGAAVVAQGILRAGSATAFGANSTLAVGPAGIVDLNGFNATVQTLTDGAGGGGLVTTSNGAVTLTIGDGFFSGMLGGGADFSLVKDSVGVLELAGNNVYTGATSVNAGTLNVSGTLANTAVTIASGAALGGVGGTLGGTVDVFDGGLLGGTLTIAGTVTSSGIIAPGNSPGTMTVANLVLEGGALNFELDTVANSDKIFIGSGTAPTINGAVVLNLTNLDGFDEGIYTLITGYTGNTIDGGQFGNLSAPTTLSGLQTVLQNNDGALQLVVSTTHLLWTGGETNGWNTADNNWSGDGTQYSDLSYVVFDNTTTTTTVVVDAAGVDPHHVIINNDSSTPYTFTGGAVLGTSLTMNGIDGTLFLQNDNTYARGLTINSGVVEVGDGGTNGSLAGNVVNNSVLSFNRSDLTTYAGVISGAGSLIQNGSGTLVLSGENTFTGITTVNNGVLELQGNFVSDITNAGATTAVIASFNPGAITITSSISGNLQFHQNGGGVMTLLGNNTYTGQTIVNSGNLVVANQLNGSSAVNVLFNGTLTVTTGASLTTPGNVMIAGTAPVGDAANLPGIFVANGTVNAASVNVSQGGILAGNGVISGPVVVESGGGMSPGNSVGKLTLSSGLSLTGGAALAFEFRDAAGTIDFNGAAAGGTGAGFGWDLIDLGAGLLDLGDASASDPIYIRVDAWQLDNSAHDDGTASTNNFDPSASYEWLFIATSHGLSPDFDVPPDDDFSRRFVIVDDQDGFGVFGQNNAFDRPTSSVGQGTFRVAFGNYGGQGQGLYITYSAIPEPGSMILAGLASLGAGWYGRRRRRESAKQRSPTDGAAPIPVDL